MILRLATRFQKHIALLLLGSFYAQMIIAAHMVRDANAGIPVRYSYDEAPFFSPAGTTKSVFDTGDSGGKKKSTKKAPNLQNKQARAVRLPQPLIPAVANRAPLTGGPSQPEMKSFSSVNANNMVDLFTGDFSYNIPLLDVGGYPVNISYHSGRTMDEDASWVGLGWNINPGSITRDMRGVPDDFDGGADTVTKVEHVKTNTSWGLSAGATIELVGLPLTNVGLGVSGGIFHSTYQGWGIEAGINPSLNVGEKNFGYLSAGLAVSDNSQNGLTLSPSLAYNVRIGETKNDGNGSLGISLSAPYNSRTGLRDIQLGMNAGMPYRFPGDGSAKKSDVGPMDFAGLTFAWSAYTPTMTMPMTSYNVTATLKPGLALWATHPNTYFQGYFGQSYIANSDTTLSLPTFGYLNFQDLNGNWAALTDFNREKEVAYRENPPVPHIAIPSYTYDAFTISGEGTGGMFRAYRGDVGFIADHLISSKSITGAVSLDLGSGSLAHGGTDLNANYSVTQSGPWLSENSLKTAIAFQRSNGLFEAAYFRNPGEKTINDTNFYNAIGGDDVVTPVLYQPGNSSPSIIATNMLTRSSLQKVTGTDTLTATNSIRNRRDKRSEVISYLTAEQASVSGLDKYIYHYGVNQFGLRYCENDSTSIDTAAGTGLMGYYFKGQDLTGSPAKIRLDSIVYFNWSTVPPFNTTQKGVPPNNLYDVSDPTFPQQNWSARWMGSLKAPASGRYTFAVHNDDGARLWINDSLIIDNWKPNVSGFDTTQVYLVGGQMYGIRLEYRQAGNYAFMELAWKTPGSNLAANLGNNKNWIPARYLYPPAPDTSMINPIVTQENRVDSFRKANHISEITVLNPDGRRYVYGIPVYNLRQKDVSFSIGTNRSDMQHGLTGYTEGVDNTTLNSNGQDGFYTREEIPGYAHSFLLTGILSPDYQDVTGDGISDDDIGDAVRFNYTKTAGIANPFGWRAPYIADSANYNEGFRSYSLDDKAHYIYGTKELWYLNSIESKTMIATFTLQHRSDLIQADENGHKNDTTKAMCLKEINLYSKADFLAHGTNATPIKTVHFVYDYELCRGINQPVNDSGKLTLKEIWFSYNGNNKGVINPYVFNYHPNNPNYATNMVDKWGTYKDPGQNPGASPTNLINNAEYPYALQDSTTAAYNVGAWTLDSIQLPSGGGIKVNYESDDYAYVQNRKATQMCNVLGFAPSATSGQAPSYTTRMYNLTGSDNLYAFIQVPYGVSTNGDLRARYLDGLSKLYFRIYVPMPATDDFGRGSEYIPCYADTAGGNWYGTTTNPNIIWVKLNGVNASADGNGGYSPLAQTAINFLRLNLPSKAFPGSQIQDNMTVFDGIALLVSMVGNVIEMITGFTNQARLLNWVNQIDPTRSFVRLDCPTMKKIGGGIRVKSVLIYDNWSSMTSNAQRQTVYGQTYDYTTTALVNGDSVQVSSGVASWEPNVGGEENPFHLPIEYVQKSSIIGPAAATYTEEPLGESFYPGASIGYSRVRVRSIHTTGTRSANGFSESKFYTSYDFPTSWDWSTLDNNTKKRYKPLLNNFLRVNAMNYLTLSQGFKVELNDMNGKLRSEATYAETDSLNPISYTENFYRVDNQNVQSKHLSNTVTTIDPYGNIDTASTIGKDAELMGDMREQTSNAIGGNLNLNVDIFTAGAWPMIIPSLLNLFQHETTRFRSAAMTKVINRYGILDSVVHMDRGSLVSSKNVLYDAETGDPVLVRTQNEFNDPVYNFTYPAHWAYKGVGPAYQNIDAVLYNLVVSNGRITQGLSQPDTTYFSAGDEVLAVSKQYIPVTGRVDTATFSAYYQLTVIDTNAKHGGPPALFLVDQYGSPFSGYDVYLKVVRSGHRNLGGSVGSVTSLANPLVQDGTGVYHLQLDANSKVVTAAAARMQQVWQVEDKHRSNVLTACVNTNQDSAAFAHQACACLQPFIDYLISSKRLVQPKANHTTVGMLIRAADSAGFLIDTSSCPLLAANYYNYYYTLTQATTAYYSDIVLGNDILTLKTASGYAIPLYSLTSSSCDSTGTVWFKNASLQMGAPDTVKIKLTPTFSANLYSSLSGCPFYLDTLLNADTSSSDLLLENNLTVNGAQRNSLSILQFNQLLRSIPYGATIQSAKLILQADTAGHLPPMYDSANSLNPVDSVGYGLTGPAGWFPNFPYDTLLYQAYRSPWFASVANRTPFQNDTVDLSGYLNDYITGGGLDTINSNTFVLTQGSGLHAPWHAPGTWATPIGIPAYLLSGYSNYYATFYSQRYSDSTKWPAISVVYTMPSAFVDTGGAYLTYNSTSACTTVYGRTCFSSITDTLVNPFHYGIVGNYRPLESVVYYSSRTDSVPTIPTNIRVNGTIANFAPFWTLQSGKWTPSTDSSRWVWNSQTTLYNRKGFELENRDPLGRYNSGLYGYGETLPTAVTQNGRYQETAFDGFEDYGFVANTCDTACSVPRPFDFSPYLSYISDSIAHTGLYSLRVPQGKSILISAPVAPAPPTTGVTLTDSTSTATGFDGVKAGASTLLPPFEPIAGQKMEFGAWVREINSCACQQYSPGHVVIKVLLSNGDSTTYTLSPAGNVIEGWQRYDASFLLPTNATQVELVMLASDTAVTYFDDVRFHPFNADMKSYVYNPVNLRLMAELDENNYATFYEYDDDGTLVRVKKETERGVLTIKETRSALLRNN